MGLLSFIKIYIGIDCGLNSQCFGLGEHLEESPSLTRYELSRLSLMPDLRCLSFSVTPQALALVMESYSLNSYAACVLS